MNDTTPLLRQTRKAIGHNIRTLRQRRGWTLQQLARRCGIDADLLDRYELGKNEIELHEMVRLVCAFNCHLENLLQG